MANVVPYAFKEGILKGQHNFTVDDAYYLALYTSAAPYAVTDSAYSSAVAGQVTGGGNGYQQGGNSCNQGAVSRTGNFITLDFSPDPQWTNASFVARSGVLYKYIDGGTTANQFLVAILILFLFHKGAFFQ